MTRARVKALHDKVNSLLTMLDLDSTLDGMLPHADMLNVIRYIPQEDPSMDQDGELEQGAQEEGEETPSTSSTGQDGGSTSQAVSTPTSPLRAPSPHRWYYHQGASGTTAQLSAPPVLPLEVPGQFRQSAWQLTYAKSSTGTTADFATGCTAKFATGSTSEATGTTADMQQDNLNEPAGTTAGPAGTTAAAGLRA